MMLRLRFNSTFFKRWHQPIQMKLNLIFRTIYIRKRVRTEVLRKRMIPTPKQIDTVANYEQKNQEFIGLDYFPDVKEAMKDFKELSKEKISKIKEISESSRKSIYDDDETIRGELKEENLKKIEKDCYIGQLSSFKYESDGESENIKVKRNIEETDKYILGFLKCSTWKEVEMVVNEVPINQSKYIEMAWIMLRTLFKYELKSNDAFLERLALLTTGVIDKMAEREYTRIWFAIAKIGYINRGLAAALCKKLTISHNNKEIFIHDFRPRHLSNIFYSISKLHRAIITDQNNNRKGNINKSKNNVFVFENENKVLSILLKEQIRKINELNEKDLSNMIFSLGLMENDLETDINLYNILADEISRPLHLERFSNLSLVNVAYGLHRGGKLNISSQVPRLYEEILLYSRISAYSTRQISILIRCLTSNKVKNQKMLIPLFERVKNDEILNMTTGLELKTIVMGAAMMRINDGDFWNAISKRLIKNKGLEILNTFDITSILYAFGLARHRDRILLDEIASKLIKDKNCISNLGRLGISNCFFGIGNLKYHNNELNELLLERANNEDILKSFTTIQISNIIFSLGQINYKKECNVVKKLVEKAKKNLDSINNNALVNILFGMFNCHFMDKKSALPLFLEALLPKRLIEYTDNQLSMLMVSLGRIKCPVGNKINLILSEIEKEHRFNKFDSQNQVRIIRAIGDIGVELGESLKESLKSFDTEKLQKLANRSILDLIQAIITETVTDPDLKFNCINESCVTERIMTYRDEEISRLVTYASYTDIISRNALQHLIENIISHGRIKSLNSECIQLALTALANTNNGYVNKLLLKALTKESTKGIRLEFYDENTLSKIFCAFSLLKVTDYKAIENITKEISKRERIMKYKEEDVVNILKGMLKADNHLIACAILNAFLNGEKTLSIKGMSSILYYMAKLRCWRQPHADYILDRVIEEDNIIKFENIDLGHMMYALGVTSYKEDKYINVIVDEIVKNERMKLLTGNEICDMTYGFSALKYEYNEKSSKFISEILMKSKLNIYNDQQITRLIKNLSEWDCVVNASELAGLVECATDKERMERNSTRTLLTIFRSLLKLQIYGMSIMGSLLHELTKKQRLSYMNDDILYELIYMCSHVKSDASIYKIRYELIRRKEQLIKDREKEKLDMIEHKKKLKELREEKVPVHIDDFEKINFKEKHQKMSTEDKIKDVYNEYQRILKREFEKELKKL